MDRAVRFYFSAFVVAAILVAAGAGAQTSEEEAPLRLSWQNNMLTIHSPRLPEGKLEAWYLEAFCRRGSTDRDWSETVIPHETTKLSSEPDGSLVRLRTVVEPGVEVLHEIRAGHDEVSFDLTIQNPTEQEVDIEWAQPCIRVGPFTGLGQEEYIRKCFICTEDGVVMLDKTRRTEAARYRGGQVYVPEGIDGDDVNPRPISPDVPTLGIIGCYSADDTLMLAMAWDQVQELFQGVIACIHADFRVGGMKAHETKRLRGKLYLTGNDAEALLARYRRDFPE